MTQTEQSKGKSSEKSSTATDELQYLLIFNSSISQCMAKTMEHLSDFVFINVPKMTLARRDTYLDIKTEIKQDTLSALRQAPLHLQTLFPDQLLKKAEEDSAKHKNKGCSSHSSSTYKRECYHPYQRSDKAREQMASKRAWKAISFYSQKRKGKSTQYSSRLDKGQSSGYFCVNLLLSRRLAGSKQTLNINKCH